MKLNISFKDTVKDRELFEALKRIEDRSNFIKTVLRANKEVVRAIEEVRKENAK